MTKVCQQQARQSQQRDTPYLVAGAFLGSDLGLGPAALSPQPLEGETMQALLDPCLPEVVPVAPSAAAAAAAADVTAAAAAGVAAAAAAGVAAAAVAVVEACNAGLAIDLLSKREKL